MAFVRFLLPKQLGKAKNNLLKKNYSWLYTVVSNTDTITHEAEYIGGLNQ